MFYQPLDIRKCKKGLDSSTVIHVLEVDKSIAPRPRIGGGMRKGSQHLGVSLSKGSLSPHIHSPYYGDYEY
jgi:hypothetical protein